MSDATRQVPSEQISIRMKSRQITLAFDEGYGSKLVVFNRDLGVVLDAGP